MIRSILSNRHVSILVLSISFMLMGCEQQFGISTFSVDDQSNVEIGGPALPTASGGVAPAPLAAPTVGAGAAPAPAAAPVPTSTSVAPSAPVTTAPAPVPAADLDAPDSDVASEDSGSGSGGVSVTIGSGISVTTGSGVSVTIGSNVPKAESTGSPASIQVAVNTTAPTAPRKGRQIIVNIESVMVRMQDANGGKLKNALVAKDLGKMDLLALSPGVLGSARLSTGAILSEVELRLHESGHEVIEDGVVICTLKVPSLKFQMKFHSVEVKADVKHSIQLPESEVQVHFTGPKECNLRPIGWPNLVEVNLQ